MIKLNSLNSRLLLAFAGLSIIICLFFIRLSALLIETAENNVYQSLLANEVSKIKNQMPLHSHKNSPLDYIAIYTSESTIPPSIAANVQRSSSGEFHLNKENNEASTRYFIYDSIIDTQGRPIYIIFDISKLNANKHLSGFKSLFLYSISASVVVLCLLSSWYLAKWLSSPIRLLTKDIANRHSQPTQTLYGIDREDEIGQLASALDASYAQIQALLEREQNFTRDVSHELRTPITLIKNTLAMHPSKELGNEATKVVSQASNELEQTVEVLLALARQENLCFEELVLLPIIEKTVLNIYNSYPDSSFDVSIKVDTKLRATGNPYLISLLCQNLVNNGFYHSNSAGMKISSDGALLIFENNIKGEVQRPYYQGLGHGQYLVNRIAEEMNWQIDISQKTGVYRVIVDTQQS